MEYLIPKQQVVFEEEIKKSRFITYLRHTNGMDEAKGFWAEVKALHPQARHWCWATVAGMPSDSRLYGCSDDGEPSGTAGKPMLNYLLGAALGEVSAVVVRYYGGIQLGTGGLVKAYGGGVQQALSLIEKQKKVLRITFRFLCEYDQFNTLQHMISERDIMVESQHFRDKIELILAVHPAEWTRFEAAVNNRFGGKILFTKINNETA